MKNIAAIAIMSLLAFTSCKQETKKDEAITNTETRAQEQKVQTISLAQTAGEFDKKTLTLEEGTYVFEIANTDVDHEVGFVLAPKGKTNEANHIKAAYVTSPVATGKTSLTSEVTLTKGEYVYFCPLNPTPEYSLVVQ